MRCVSNLHQYSLKIQNAFILSPLDMRGLRQRPEESIVNLEKDLSVIKGI